MMDDMNYLGMYQEEPPDPRFTHRENESLDYGNRPILVADATLEQSTENDPAVTGVVFRQPM